MADVTVSEGIGLLKVLRERHQELVGLRNQNSYKESRYLGADANKVIEKNPVYDVKALDKTINQVALAVRQLDTAIKASNAITKLSFTWDDSLLGKIE